MKLNLAAFVMALQRHGIPVTPYDVADAVWLGSRLVPDHDGAEREPLTPDTADSNAADPSSPLNAGGDAAETTTSDDAEADAANASGQRAPSADGAELFARGFEGSGSPSIRGHALSVPDAPRVPNMLGLEGALRPLSRLRPSRRFFEFDEEATVDQIAGTRLWTPVMRPRRERGMEGVLICERSPTMRIWHDFGRALHGLFWRSGAFAWLDFAFLETDGDKPRLVSPADARRRRDWRSACRPAAPRWIFFCTDCLSDRWLSGEVPEIVDYWKRRHPTAVLQMLPVDMWRRTSLRRATFTTAPSRADGVDPHSAAGTRFVPIAPIKSQTLLELSRYLAGSARSGVLGYCNPPEAFDERAVFETVRGSSPSETVRTPDETLLRFIASVSPTTLDVARSLAAAPLSPPVMRLIQHVLGRGAELAHLAELFNSGIVKRISPKVPGENPNHIEYDFVGGVRKLLLKQVSLERIKRVWEILSEYVNAKFGQGVDFSAVLNDPKSARSFASIRVQDAPQSFGRVFGFVLKQLGGDFALVLEERDEPVPALHGAGVDAGFSMSRPSNARVPTGVRTIDLTDLPEVLHGARAENWRMLALLGALDADRAGLRAAHLHERNWPATHIFFLKTPLTTIPPPLLALPNLQVLDLSFNRLSDADLVAISKRSNLTSLSLAANRITIDGAYTVSALTGLESLDLSENRIEDAGAQSLATLTQLTSLNLASNRIGDNGVGNLTSLRRLAELDLANNQIGDQGARELATLSSLTQLSLRDNRIGEDGARAILEAWLAPPPRGERKRLDLRGNGDLSTVLPPEALNITHAQAILEVYRRFRDEKKRSALRPLLEARLIVVGNEAVGKTSLIRYLVDGKPRDPNEGRTEGTRTRERIETKAWTAEGTDIRLNVWDFGGQEMYHRTHQFFFSARSLYLLVLEARREDDLSYLDWLKTIRNWAADAPVIIVINKSDGEQSKMLQLTKDHFRDWPNIVDVVRTSCDPGDAAAASIQALRNLIIWTLETDDRLKHVRDPVPNAWYEVKSQVTDLARRRSKFDIADFNRLCHEQNITDHNEQQALLRVLHHLGTIVAHGLDHDDHTTAAIRHITLLDPNWLTTAIYSTISYAKDATRDLPPGEIRRTDLAKILPKNRYDPKSDDYDFILDMMCHPDLQLAFEFAGEPRGRYLIPEALSTAEPEYANVWPADALRFRYAYDVLPRGFVPQFIVMAHRSLPPFPSYWRSGVILQAAECRILVRADFNAPPRIDIQVAGPTNRRREALGVVVNYLEHIHHMNRGLGVQAVVPLPDQPTEHVPYDYLLKMEHRYGVNYSFHPAGATREAPYSVRELLEGVRHDDSSSDTSPLSATSGYTGSQPRTVYIGDTVRDITISIGENITQNVKSKIAGSFNRAAAATDDLKALLQQLTTEVAKIVEQLPADKQQDAADALETVGKEAVREKPRRKWWDLGVEGLRDAATAVGAIGKTAIALLDQIQARIFPV